jgi:hypothetical protein
MPAMRLALSVLALTLLLAPPARAQDVDAQLAAAVDDLIPVQGRGYAKVRKGHPQVAGSLKLADPIADAGRVIDRVDVMQEWDCKAGRYRITRKTFRAADGQYVRSDPRNGPWIPVVGKAPGAETLKRLCPKRAAEEAVMEPEIPPGAQVITFPQK